ncbi:MAG: general stress protein [Microcoleaceae cyanobacterium]
MSTGTSTDYRRAIGVFDTRREVEAAIYALRDEGFNLDRVTVIAPDSDPATKDADIEVHEEARGNKADEGAATGAAAGGALGTITGLLVGLGTLAIPGVGPILLAGVGATALATTLAGTAIGAAAGGIIGGLVGLGIPEERAKIYNDHLAQGHYLMLITGRPQTINQAESVVSNHGIHHWEVYEAHDVEARAVDDREDMLPETRSTVHTDPEAEMETEEKAVKVDSADQSRRFEQAEVVKQGTAATDPTVVVVDKRDETYKRS